MVRDFFLYLTGRANGYVCMPGTGEWISLGTGWLRAAQSTYASAVVACNHERANSEALAGKAWQEIFGGAAPLRVS